MKLEQFEQALELEKCGTFSQAARNLYMSQPNLSLSIKQLEDELNCQIFSRTSEGVVPTAEGRELLDHMRMIHSQYRLLKNFGKEKEAPRLSLRLATTNLNRLVPYFIKISDKYMGSPINFSYYNCLTIQDVVDRVVSLQVDFAVIGLMDPYVKNTISMLHSHHIEYHPFPKNPIYGVIGPKNPLYGRNTPICLNDLSNQTILTFGNDAEDPVGAVYNSAQIKIPCYGRIHVNNCYLFYEMADNTPAMGLISCKTNAFYQKKTWPGLELVEIKDFPVQSEAGWIKLRRIPLSEIASELLSDLSQVI